jgi:hypothetical protein
MALPHDESIQIELLRLLADAPNGQMHCNDVYRTLAQSFPQLSPAECKDPYPPSLSHWANRVQWARHHLVEQGLILRPYAGGGRGYWAISAKGREALAVRHATAAKLLAELEAL